MNRRAPFEVRIARRVLTLAKSGAVGCRCTAAASAAVMEALGMRHAAAMHLSSDRDWTSRDWREHIEEEHSILFPRLRLLGEGASVDKLEEDHVAYLRLLETGRELPEGSVREHAGLEDALIEKHGNALISEASDTSAMTGATGTMTLAHPLATSPSLAAADAREHSPPPSRHILQFIIGAAGTAALGYLGFALGGWPFALLGTAAGAYATAKPRPPKIAPTPLPDGPGFTADVAASLDHLATATENEEAKAAGAKDADAARIATIKKYGKMIPYVGDYWGSAVDTAVFMDKAATSLGYGYRAEYDAEHCAPGVDCDFADHAAFELTRWLGHGWIPTNPELVLTAKNGIRSFGITLEAMADRAEYLSIVRFGTNVQWTGTAFTSDTAPADGGASTAALRAYGALTAKWALDKRVAPYLEAIANGYGTIPVWVDPIPQVLDANGGRAGDFIGRIIAVERGLDIDVTVARARHFWDWWAKDAIDEGHAHGGFDVGEYAVLSRVADTFLRVWKGA